MGIDLDFPIAFAKSQIAAGTVLPTSGVVFISVRDQDKEAIVPVARTLADAGLTIMATSGTHEVLSRHGIEATRVTKLAEGRPNLIDYIKNGKVQLIINTPTKKGPATDEGKIRATSVLHKIPIVTTLTAAHAAARAILELQKSGWDVRPLQSYAAGAR
jgi:carbamoyl-phosphate synthase large subunit